MNLELSEHEIPNHLKEFFEPVKSVELRAKDLCMIPARVALALQRDGWWIRSQIIWAKGVSFCPTYSGSVMPESVRDRPTQSYEHVFLLAKSKTYYYDATAVREAHKPESLKRVSSPLNTDRQRDYPGSAQTLRMGEGQQMCHPAGRNLRSVWVINPKPSRLKHYAAFPPALVEPMVLASTSERGCCPECGKPWERVVEKENPPANVYTDSHKPDAIKPVSHPEIGRAGMGQKLQNWYNEHPQRTTGWRPGCDCGVPACRACGSVVDYDYEYNQSITRAQVPPLQCRYDGQKEEPGILLSDVLCEGAAGATRQGMPPVPPDVPAKKQATIPLQSGMFKEMDALASEHGQGMDEDYGGLHNDLETGSSSGNQGGLHNGASVGNGTGTRPPASEIRGSSSQEWQEGRQSPRESGASAEKRTRLYEASDLYSDMPTLRYGVPLSGQCPHCAGDLVLAPHPPRPCIVLDCFGGTMTVGEVCAKHGRHFIGLDLKREYVEMGRERCANVQIAMAL